MEVKKPFWQPSTATWQCRVLLCGCTVVSLVVRMGAVLTPVVGEIMQGVKKFIIQFSTIVLYQLAHHWTIFSL